MEKTPMMLKYEQKTGKPSTRFVTDEVHSVGVEVWHYEYIKWVEAENERLEQTPNLPNDYELFLVYLAHNNGDFRKAVREATNDGRCSLDAMEWFAMMLGISWEPDWR